MSFDRIRVYKISCELELELYELIKKIPHFLIDPLCKQILRSSSSISANIVEGNSKRYYIKEFIKFLYISLGSCDETQHHLKILMNRGYIDNKNYLDLVKKYKNLSVRILNFIKYLKK